MKAGLRLEKVHRIIKFNQSPWLKCYIDLNTEKRKLAITDFKNDFYKLINNSVFGKLKKKKKSIQYHFDDLDVIWLLFLKLNQ